MVIDKIVLSQDRTWCYVYYVDAPTLKFDFKELGINYLQGLEMIYSWYSDTAEAA
jgi:hypothetical protein